MAEIKNTYISEFFSDVEQSFNLANLVRQGDFQLNDSTGKRSEFMEQIENAKNRGLISVSN